MKEEEGKEKHHSNDPFVTRLTNLFPLFVVNLMS